MPPNLLRYRKEEAKATFNSLVFSAKSIHIEDVDTNVGYVCDPIVSKSTGGDNIATGWQAHLPCQQNIAQLSPKNLSYTPVGNA